MKRKILSIILAGGMVLALAGCGGTKDASTPAENTDTASDSSQKEDTDASSDSSHEGSTDASSDSGESSLAAKADANGNYIVNGSFEEADFTGWTVTNMDDVTEELDIYDRATDAFEGGQSLHFYSGSHDVNFTAEQKLSGLEAGSYKLTAHIQGEAAGDENASVYFYAVVNGEEVKADGKLGGYVNWDTVEIPGLKVEDGEITVGICVKTAAGGWGTIDDITLVKE